MSTAAEIESAIEALPPEQVEKLFSWLEARKAKVSDEVGAHAGLVGFMKDKIILKPGWDEPLEDFKE